MEGGMAGVDLLNDDLPFTFHFLLKRLTPLAFVDRNRVDQPFRILTLRITLFIHPNFPVGENLKEHTLSFPLPLISKWQAPKFSLTVDRRDYIFNPSFCLQSERKDANDG
jgi:hypothetical protein